VFARPDGTPVHADPFSMTSDRDVKKLARRKVRLQHLHHTYTTLAARAGVDA
jgi:hypothetical protein